MQLICDSGSTKADWLVPASGKQALKFSTKGINPFFHDEGYIIEQLGGNFPTSISPSQVHKIYFYGAGCSTDFFRNKIKSALKHFFTNADIEVNHDLLGATRALCGKIAGIACILGTGSNSCLYDGEKITDHIANLGYLVGDEGSGSYLGKSLIRSYFYREMPDELSGKMQQLVAGGRAEFIRKSYSNDSSPNVYFASFAPFMSANQQHPFIRQMVYDAFSEFINRHVRKYERYDELPIHFTGSVAYYFSEILRQVLADQKLEVGTIIQKPIDALAEFHC